MLCHWQLFWFIDWLLNDIWQSAGATINGLAEDWQVVMHPVPVCLKVRHVSFGKGISQTWECCLASTAGCPDHMPAKGTTGIISMRPSIHLSVFLYRATLYLKAYLSGKASGSRKARSSSISWSLIFLTISGLKTRQSRNRRRRLGLMGCREPTSASLLLALPLTFPGRNQSRRWSFPGCRLPCESFELPVLVVLGQGTKEDLSCFFTMSFTVQGRQTEQSYPWRCFLAAAFPDKAPQQWLGKPPNSLRSRCWP